MSIENVILVAGVHGVSGRAAAEHWASLPGTRVYGLSRRSAPLPAGVEAISADLLDRNDLQQVSSWAFADAILRLVEYDNITSTIKACRAGFHDCIDTDACSKASSPTSAKTGSFHSRKV